ncbi:MAG: AAA family ATPase [Acidimicrobiia bacterium]
MAGACRPCRSGQAGGGGGGGIHRKVHHGRRSRRTARDGEGRRHRADQSWASDEFHHIAVSHHHAANALARRAVGGVVVLDTDALVTSVWHRRYLGHDDADLEIVSARNRPDLYLVCAPDIAWVQDGTRESAGHRSAMHAHTLTAVEASGVPHAVLSGPHELRLQRACELVARHLTVATLI